jgi:hypothetical protein
VPDGVNLIEGCLLVGARNARGKPANKDSEISHKALLSRAEAIQGQRRSNSTTQFNDLLCRSIEINNKLSAVIDFLSVLLVKLYRAVASKPPT